jgi:hypothetical protein
MKPWFGGVFGFFLFLDDIDSDELEETRDPEPIRGSVGVVV